MKTFNFLFNSENKSVLLYPSRIQVSETFLDGCSCNGSKSGAMERKGKKVFFPCNSILKGKKKHGNWSSFVNRKVVVVLTRRSAVSCDCRLSIVLLFVGLVVRHGESAGSWVGRCGEREVLMV